MKHVDGRERTKTRCGVLGGGVPGVLGEQCVPQHSPRSLDRDLYLALLVEDPPIR